MLWGFVMPVWLLIFFASLKAQLACLGCDLTKETQDKNQCHWAKYTHFLVFSFFLLRKHSPLYKYWNAFLWDVIISSDFVIFRHSAKMLSPYSFFLFSIWLLILFAGEHQVGSSSTIVGTKFESISENVPFLYRWHYGWGFRTLHVHRSYLLSHECRFFFFKLNFWKINFYLQTCKKWGGRPSGSIYYVCAPAKTVEVVKYKDEDPEKVGADLELGRGCVRSKKKRSGLVITRLCWPSS